MRLARTVSALPILLALVVLSACTHEEITINRGERIHHDDFDYLVTSVDRVDRLGDLAARGEFYVVGFTVENHAKRVDHPWSDDLAFVVDQSGTVYNNDLAAQRAAAGLRKLALSRRHVTPAGSTENTLFVFDLPKNAATPALKVRGEFLMGDLFDGNKYERTRVRLQ